MNKTLREQVERILDTESDKAIHDVIVQMTPPRDDQNAVLEASAAAMQRRYLTISPRDLAPPAADLLFPTDSPLTTRVRRRLRASNSMTSQFALNRIPSRGLDDLKASGLSAFHSLHENDAILRSFERTPASAPTSADNVPTGRSSRGSWSSRSMFLRVRSNDLRDIANSVEGIGGIYANGTISTPPIVEVNDTALDSDSYTAATWGMEKIGAPSVWGTFGARGAMAPYIPQESGHGTPVKVAVLDTGVDPNHPELQGKVVQWAEFDKNGNPIASRPHDSAKHGTHVCGTIAGGTQIPPSSGAPLIGVAPDAALMVALVLKGNSGTHAQILAGMDWAIENGAEIINMSLGGVNLQPDVIDLYTQAILTANLNGIPVIISIGNEGAQTTGLPGNDYYAFSVGATDQSDRAAGFSGGRTQVVRSSRYIEDKYLPLYFSKPEIAAPGVAIRSCTPRGRYETWNGTSMAAPHVAGALALLLSATKIRSVSAARRAFLLQDLIISSVEELGEAGRDHRFGFGRLDALRAVTMAVDLGY